MRPPTVAALIAVGSLLANEVLAQAPPVEVLQRIEQAGAFTESFVGSYRLVVSSSVSKPNGSAREEDFTDVRHERRADGSTAETIVRTSKNGEDTTATTRAEREKERQKQSEKAPKPQKGDGKELSLGLSIPGPSSADHYDYEALAAAGNVCRARFKPREEHLADDGISKGELRWRCDTREPLLVIASPADPPTGLSELTMTMEIARSGPALYVGTVTVDGVGGFLFFKRKFHVRQVLSEVVPGAVPRELPAGELR